MQSLFELIPGLVDISQAASARIMEIYHRPEGFEVQRKMDQSPVTEADMASNDALLEGLARLTPEIPVLSEEVSIDYQDRHHWQQFWLVDPLDGTKEFIAQNDEFCINLALMDGNQVLLGFIFAPVTGDYWWGSQQLGAFKGADQAITANKVDRTIQVIGSRRFKGQGTWRDELASAGYGFEQVSQGSALKFCRIGDGRADLYPRLGPTCEWDTAAGQGIIEGAGGRLVTESGVEFQYNKESLLNPGFFAASDPKLIDILFP